MKKMSVLVLVLVLLLACVPLSLGAADVLPKGIATYAVDDAAVAKAQAPRSGGVLKYGDLNEDNKINLKDLGLLQQRLNGWDVTVNLAAADVTGDGKVNLKDLGLLQQYLNGWDVRFPDPPTTPTEPTTPPTEPTTPPTEPTTPPTEPTTPPTEPTTPPTEPTTPPTEPTTPPTEPTTPSTEPTTPPTKPTNPPVLTDATIYVESTTVNKGTGEVKVNVRVVNNPGIMTATLSVDVDDAVLGFKSASKTGYDSLYLTAPGNKQVASPYRFLLDGMELTEADKVDGVLFTITFTIKDIAATGDYAVRLSYMQGDITDENYAWLDVAVQDGTITIQ